MSIKSLIDHSGEFEEGIIYGFGSEKNEIKNQLSLKNGGGQREKERNEQFTGVDGVQLVTGCH